MENTTATTTKNSNYEIIRINILDLNSDNTFNYPSKAQTDDLAMQLKNADDEQENQSKGF